MANFAHSWRATDGEVGHGALVQSPAAFAVAKGVLAMAKGVHECCGTVMLPFYGSPKGELGKS